MYRNSQHIVCLNLSYILFVFNINDEVLIPSLWWYEITNVLIIAERRKRVTPADAAKILSLYSRFTGTLP